MKTKKHFAQQIIISLQNSYPNLDFKIQEREVFLRMDAVVNSMAERNYFDNWKFTGEGVDEQYITTWDNIEVVDQEDEDPSYFVFPANYAALPRNRGIEEIWPLKYQLNGADHSVVIMSHSDVRRFKNLYAGNLEGRLGGYPKGNRFYFTSCGVKKKYGNVGVRLVIRDSSQISNTEPYPIPANREQELIETVVLWFINKRDQPTDKVRDGADQP